MTGFVLQLSLGVVTGKVGPGVYTLRRSRVFGRLLW